MALSENSIVEINYTGKLLEGEIFDTTVEETAKKAEIFDEHAKYGKKTFILGEKELLPGLENAIKEMNESEEKTIKLTPEQAFGNRKPELAMVVPLQEFIKRKIKPIRGLIIELNGANGKIQSVSGGRVRVDFNHPLAGKEVEYQLKLEKILTNQKEQIEAMIEKFFSFIPKNELSYEVKGEELEIKTSAKNDKIISPIKIAVTQIITKHANGIKSVKFVIEENTEEKNPNTEKNETAKEENKNNTEKIEEKTVEEKKE